MVESEGKPNINFINFNFLELDERVYAYTILIILNKSILPQIFSDIKNKIDYIICSLIHQRLFYEFRVNIMNFKNLLLVKNFYTRLYNWPI